MSRAPARRRRAPFALVPRLHDEGDAAPGRHEPAAEVQFEAGFPVAPGIDAFAEKDDDLGVDDVHDAGQRAPQGRPGLTVDRPGTRVAVVGGLTQIGGCAIRAEDAALDTRAQQRLLTRVRLQAPAQPTPAQRPVGRDQHAADLTGPA